MIINLTDAESKTTVLVNTDHLIRVLSLCMDDYDGRSRLHIVGETTIDVTETPDEIYAMINHTSTDKGTHLPLSWPLFY